MKTDLKSGYYTAVQESSVVEVVADLLENFRTVWWDTGSELPEFARTFSLREQLANERALDACLRALVQELRALPGAGAGRPAVQERIARLAVRLAKGGLGLDDADIQAIQEYGFAEVGLAFFRDAHAFDPGLREVDIYQASRNVWSMNFMQLLTGQSIELTPAVFAYSLLYPYTDNYLDDPQVPPAIKRSFNERFRQRLAGEPVQPANRHEAAIADLISRIEGQFDRARFPQVYASLQAIHRGQGRSLALAQGKASPYEVDVLGLTFEKGGASTLADGYLVAGSLSPAEREWTFFYGVFTQLMDDLEDARQDLAEGRLTIFSQTARRWPLDALTNRTIHLGRRLIERLQTLDAPGSAPFKRMIGKCLDPLLIASVGDLQEFYTRPYRRELERHLPVRFGFLRKQRRTLARMGVPVADLAEAFVETGLPALF